jgi:3-hydroxymyristoyl/3-hydroxydecanoyl-(acyl carrier protein) dehydratase
MPSAALLDTTTLDFARLAATREEVLGVLKQRGRFAMIDGVLAGEPGSPLVIGYKDIHVDDWWAADHIPAGRSSPACS